MRLGVKAGLVLGATFVLGGLVGALTAGFLGQHRQDARRRMGGPGGFVEQTERLIEPRDSAQRRTLRPYLEATDRRNRGIVDGARAEMQVALDSLRGEIAPLLDAEQLRRFDGFVRRSPSGPGLGPKNRPDGPPPGFERGPGNWRREGPPPGPPPL